MMATPYVATKHGVVVLSTSLRLKVVFRGQATELRLQEEEETEDKGRNIIAYCKIKSFEAGYRTQQV